MLIERLWVGNSLRNFNYLLACPESGEALAIDPLDHRSVLALARDKGWQITQILNTHEHHDHIGGNPAVVAAVQQRVTEGTQEDCVGFGAKGVGHLFRKRRAVSKVAVSAEIVSMPWIAAGTAHWPGTLAHRRRAPSRSSAWW